MQDKIEINEVIKEMDKINNIGVEGIIEETKIDEIIILKKEKSEISELYSLMYDLENRINQLELIVNKEPIEGVKMIQDGVIKVMREKDVDILIKKGWKLYK